MDGLWFQAYGYFVTQTQAIAHQLGKQVLVWEEIWALFGTQLDRATTVINTRFNPKQGPSRPVAVPNATAHGYRVVRSENIHWYLDQTVGKPWTATYDFEPCADIPEESCQYILGGAASMWGETVDTSDLMQTVWPRAGGKCARNLPLLVIYGCILTECSQRWERSCGAHGRTPIAARRPCHGTWLFVAC